MENSQKFQHISRARQQCGPGLDQLVAALAGRVRHPARQCKNLFPLLQPQLCRDQRPALLIGLDHQNRIRKPTDNPVADREILRPRRLSGRIFRDKTPLLFQLPKQRIILLRVTYIDATAQHAPGFTASRQGAPVSGSIHAQSQSADHRHAGGCQLPAHDPGHLLAVHRAASGADNRDRGFLRRRQASLNPKPHWIVIDMPQPFGIFRV